MWARSTSTSGVTCALRELGALARDTNVLAPINATFERDYANSRTKCPANTAAGRADILSPGKTS